MGTGDCRRDRIAKPTLYHFFGSKQGLLEALFGEYASVLDEAVQRAVDYRGDLPLTLDRTVAAYTDFAAREPLFYHLELALYFAPPDSAAYRTAVRHYTHRHTMIRNVFVKAVHEHGNMRGPQERYAVSLVGMMNSYIALQPRHRSTVQRSEA